VSTTQVTVLAVGNPIMGDDGVGAELLARVRAARADARIEFVDGVTGGMDLVPVVENRPRVLVLDAVAVAGAEPGTVVDLPGHRLRAALGAKMSPHQVGLLDVLSVVRLLGREPGEVRVVGVVPVTVELRLGLSPVVAAALDDAATVAVRVLDRWLDEPATALVAPGHGVGQR
jgi:hydrogenase maturation protease